MQHKAFNTQCPIARSLERVGEWWSILILRDAFLGLTRFDQFQKSLGIAPNMLTRRLSTLVDSGLLERRAYSERPLRYEYVLTPRGRDFRQVLWALVAWGNKHFAPEGRSVILVDAKTGEAAEPVLVDGRSGRRLEAPDFKVTAGPAADERTRLRYSVSQRAGGIAGGGSTAEGEWVVKGDANVGGASAGDRTGVMATDVGLSGSATPEKRKPRRARSGKKSGASS